MASLDFISANIYAEAATLAGIESATTLWMKWVVRGDKLNGIASGQELWWLIGSNKCRLSIKERSSPTTDVEFYLNVNGGAQEVFVNIAKSSFSTTAYYVIYAHCGPSNALYLAVRNAADGTLLGSGSASTATLNTGAGQGRIQLVRPGPFSTTSPGCRVAGWACGTTIPGSEWAEPAVGDCLSLCYFDDSSGTTATVEAGNSFSLLNNGGAASGSEYAWQTGDGPWNGGGAPAGNNLFAHAHGLL